MGSEILGIGYIGVTASDLDGWVDFAEQVLGMQCVEHTAERARFKMDVRASRLTVHRGDVGRMSYVGWEVQNKDALEQLAARLDTAGVSVERAGRDLATERGVAELIAFDDPSRNRLEVFYGACTEEVNVFVSPTGTRFVTGEQGMGHITLHVSEYEATVDFYRTLLRFGVSDFMEGPPLRATFLGCNPRHHSVGLLDTKQDEAHHFMVEADSLDAVGQAYDRCQDGSAPIVMTLGRHWNDHMTSFYSESPSGFAVELGWGGRIVDRETWPTIQGTGEMSFWGHRPVGPGAAS